MAEKTANEPSDDDKALLTAARNGHVKVVQYFVGLGAKVEWGDDDGQTPLIEASFYGHLNVVQYLVSQGAHVERGNNFGLTPLFAASSKGHLNVVEYLVGQGAQINRSTNDGGTPLRYASRDGHLHVVEYLVGQGAQVDTCDDNDVTPLQCASHEGHLDVVEYLVGQGARVERGNQCGETPLIAASNKGHVDVVEYLVSQGAQIDGGDESGSTPLHYASQDGHLDVVRYLVSQGAQIERVNNYSLTPLLFASLKGHLDVVQYLVSQGAQVEVSDNSGSTPLQDASYKGHLNVVQYLVSQGAQVERGDNIGSTPLHVASQRGHLDLVQYLVGQGTQVERSNNNGSTPLHYASQEGHLDVVRYLVSQGAQPNTCQNDGTTPLHYASFMGHLDIVKYLVGQGAQVERDNNDGLTPLHLAIRNGHLDVVQYLKSEQGHRKEASLEDSEPKANRRKTEETTEPARDDTPSTSGQTSSTTDGFDDVIIKVADTISDDGDLKRLGLELGVQITVINRALETNWARGTKTSNGNVMMLQNWAHTVESSKLIQTLRTALKKAGLLEVEETCFTSSSRDDTDNKEGNDDQLTSLKHDSGIDQDDISFGGLSAPPEILARGPRARRAYAEAAQAGTKKVFRTRLMLVGQERVGKTSLKKTLTGQGFDPKEALTDGVQTTDACEICIEVAKAGEKMWSIHNEGHRNEDTKEGEYKKALADEIAKKLTTTPPKDQKKIEPHSRGLNPEEAEDKYKKAPADEIAMRPSVTLAQDRESLEPHIDTTLARGLNPVEAEEFVLDNVEAPKSKEEGDIMPNQIASLVEQMLKKRVHEMGTDRTESVRGEGVSLSIWDFAGHDVYYTTHQVFLTWRAIYVIVFDLSRSLDSVVPPVSRDEYYKMAKRGAKSELTCLEFINFWLCSIYAHAVAPSSVIDKNTSKTAQKSPPIFIVGTHRESVKGDAKEKREKIDCAFEKIRNSIKKKPFECHVIPKFYAIENSLEDKDEELVALRRHIEKVAMEEPYMGEEIPLRWLLFEEALAADKINYMSLDQAKELTQPVGMESERELITMLTFYHDLGHVVYYGGIEDQSSLLRDMVILNPQWLIDVFKQVITILDPAERDGIVSDAWTTLVEDGILEDRLIQHMWHDFLEQKEALVKLMAKFDLICEAPVEQFQQEQQDGLDAEVSNETEKVVKKRYYVPSRLTSHCSPENIAQIKSSTDFYVDFRGFLTDGLFHRLMTRVVRWMVERDGEPVNLFYRQISLMVDEEHHALLEMLPPPEATIKVTVFQGAVADSDDIGNNHQPPAPSAVKEVMDFVTETLDSLIQHWARRIEYDVRFLCPTCSEKKLLKDCFKGISLKCGLHNIPSAAIRFKFGLTKASLGNTDSTSPRSLASTVVDMPPQGASAAVGEATSTARKVRDAMLNELSRHILSNDYEIFSEKLGIGHTQAMNLVVKHLNDYEKATRDCMAIWMNRSTRTVADLHEVLRAAKLGGLIDHCN